MPFRPDASPSLDAFSRQAAKQATTTKQSKSENGEKLSADEYQELIEHGAGNGDRSEMFHRVVWHLAAQGKTLIEIVTLLRQQPNGIAAKYLKPKDRLEVETKRSFKKYTANNPPIISKWNKDHAHVLAGAKSAVLQEFKNADGHTESGRLSEWPCSTASAWCSNGRRLH